MIYKGFRLKAVGFQHSRIVISIYEEKNEDTRQ